MSSAGNPPLTVRPSVFISYASEDRVAARRLRDTLAATGLEVWYDENELGGGDAWDQKIRRQIRDCDYFMPVISAATERRKEGYFRREWRLATERTMDMADDVLFLLPVAIDDTNQMTARVPDRFLTVQWLRAPEGKTTPALEALTKRLLVGDHTIMTRPPMVVRPSAGGGQFAPMAEEPTSPLVPPFPRVPDRITRWPMFFVRIIAWLLTLAWRPFARAPRWVGTVAIAWIVFTVVGTTMCNRRRKPAEPAAATTQKTDDIRRTGKRSTDEPILPPRPVPKDIPPDPTRGSRDPARRTAKTEIDQRAMNKPLVIVPFGRDPGDPAGSQFATAVFTACYGQLLLTRPGGAAPTSELPGPDTEESLTALGRTLNANQVLGARIAVLDGKKILAVRLIKIADGTITWSADYPIEGAEPSTVANAIATGVLRALPSRKK